MSIFLGCHLSFILQYVWDQMKITCVLFDTTMRFAVLFLSTTLPLSSHAFLHHITTCGGRRSSRVGAITSVSSLINSQHAIFVSNDDVADDYAKVVDSSFSSKNNAQRQRRQQSTMSVANIILLLLATLSTITIPTIANAVSGGGLDYAGTDISNANYGNGNYKSKDFTQVIAKSTNFANSNLSGCRFYKAYLVNTNFDNAIVTGASFEDTSMDNANLHNVIAIGAYFGPSLLDVATLEGGDFSDAQIPIKTLALICNREDVKGSNPITGVNTRDSLMCLD